MFGCRCVCGNAVSEEYAVSTSRLRRREMKKKGRESASSKTDRVRVGGRMEGLDWPAWSGQSLSGENWTESGWEGIGQHWDRQKCWRQPKSAD